MDIELTKTQKESVEYEGGDLLVKGLPGSGKSVVLMQRAMRFNKKAIDANERKRIVILTFTGSLVKYTKELVDITGLHPCMIEISTVDKICFDLYRKATKKRFVNVLSKNQDRIAVIDRAIQNHLDRVKEKHRFHDIDAEFWADEFLWIKQKCLTTAEAYIESERTGRGGKVRMTKADKAVAYELFTEYQTLLNKSSRLDWEDLYIYLLQNLEKINEADRYDYVLVDEAQDLSYVKLKIAKHLARRSITIAADKAQKIYSTSFSWKELGIDIRGRASKSLDSTFRSTKQIVQLAESLLEVNRALQEDQSEYTDPVYPTREGALPQVISCTDAADERDFVLELIKTHLNANEVIGVLYRSYSERLRICKWFANEGLAYQEIKKESPWSLNQPGIKLSTLHSSKGLEFDVIIIPFFTEACFPLAALLEDADDGQAIEIKAQERSLVYVGMTRARYDLYLTYSGSPSSFIQDFEPAYYDFKDSVGNSKTKPPRLFIPPVKSTQEVSIENKPAKSGGWSIFDSNRAAKAKSPVESSVRNGSTVRAQVAGKSKISKYIIDTRKYPAQASLIGKKVGDTVIFGGNELTIIEITK